MDEDGNQEATIAIQAQWAHQTVPSGATLLLGINALCNGAREI